MGICLPMQGIQVRSLVRGDPTCHKATKHIHHSYPGHTPAASAPCMQSLHREKTEHRNDEQPLLNACRKPTHSSKDPAKNLKKKFYKKKPFTLISYRTYSYSFYFLLQILKCCCCCSAAQSYPNSLRPHGLQHTRLPCPSPFSQSLLKLMFIESVAPSNHPILCHPLLLLPSIFPRIRVFSTESALHIRWPKYWSFSFSISASNEHPGLIFFRMDWFDLLAVQGTLKSLLQHHSSEASIPQCSAFFMFQPSHPYMTMGKP